MNEFVKSFVGTELQEVSGVGEKLFDAHGEFRIEAVLQFLWRHSKDPEMVNGKWKMDMKVRNGNGRRK